MRETGKRKIYPFPVVTWIVVLFLSSCGANSGDQQIKTAPASQCIPESIAETVWQKEIFSDHISRLAVSPDGSLVVIGGMELVSLSAVDGSERWRSSFADNDIDPARQGTPAPLGDRILLPLFPDYNIDSPGGILGYSSQDGTLLWNMELPRGDNVATADQFLPSVAHPPVRGQGNLALVAVDFTPTCSPEFGHRLLALDVANGNVLWTFRNPESCGVIRRPIIGPDGTVYVAMKHVYALDPSTGGELRKFECPGVDCSGVSVRADNTVFVHYGDQVTALNSNFDVQWTYIAPSRRISLDPITVGEEGEIYMLLFPRNSDDTYELVRVEEGGAMTWRRPVDLVNRVGIVAQQLLIEGWSSATGFVSLDPRTSDIQWGLVAGEEDEFQTAAAVGTEGRLFVSTWNDEDIVRIYAFSLSQANTSTACAPCALQCQDDAFVARCDAEGTAVGKAEQSCISPLSNTGRCQQNICLEERISDDEFIRCACSCECDVCTADVSGEFVLHNKTCADICTETCAGGPSWCGSPVIVAQEECISPQPAEM